MKNYYEILELKQTASLDQIRDQYHLMVHAWHPDKFPDGELKKKAEEKILEINEAYSVLSDPTSRKNYDDSLPQKTSKPRPKAQPESYTGTTEKSQPESTKHQPYENPPTEANDTYCECCRLPAETKYVEFYENVGMIFIRNHRAAKGNLCRSCIEYFFWNFTGKTILFGWWGIISFIVTPFILLNNIFRYVFCLNLKKPIVSISPNPSPFWVFSSIAGCIFGVILLFNIFSQYSSTPNSTYSPPPTSKPISTKRVVVVSKTATKVPTKWKSPTPSVSCYLWSEITSADIGSNLCVYGTIHRTRDVLNNFQILFNRGDTDFFLSSGTYFYNVSSGDCVVAEGKVLKSGSGVPYMNISEALYKCEPWMK